MVRGDDEHMTFVCSRPQFCTNEWAAFDIEGTLNRSRASLGQGAILLFRIDISHIVKINGESDRCPYQQLFTVCAECRSQCFVPFDEFVKGLL